MQRGYLVITELFLPTKGGTAVWFDEVYRRLGGKEIAIVTAAVDGAAEHDADHPNTIHRLELRRIPWLRPESLAMYLKLLAKALALVLRQRFDAVHAGRVLPEGLVALLVARLARRPCVIYVHGEELTGWGRGNKYRVMRWVLGHASRLIANSEFTRQTLVGMGVTPTKVEVIYPGVDTARFQPGLEIGDLRDRIGIPSNARLVISVGRLSRRKGFDTVIRCLPGLLEAGVDVHYAIIGVGEDASYLDSVAFECGVAERVHRLGHVSPDELPRWYNACDVFALVNREVNGDTEGFGMVFIEAAACGKPALAGLAGGTGSAVLDGETGVRVDGDSLSEVQRALFRLLTDEALRDRLGGAGQVRAHEDFGWDAVAARTARIEI